MADKMSLAQLIHPVDVESFLGDVWGQNVSLYSPSSGPAVNEIIDLSSFEMLLATTNRANEGWLQLARGERKAFPADAIDDEGMLDLRRVRAAFSAGETLYLTKAHRLCPPLMHLCQAIESDLGVHGVALRAAVSAHIFLTPSRSQGFAAHRDEHASFVLQIDGSKEWTVYDEETSSSEGVYRPGGVELGSLASAKRRTFHLKPGDVLYIPEWWVHEARTSDSHSLHVTLRIFPLRWGDVLRELCAEVPILGDPIPRHGAGDPHGLAEGLVSLLRSSGFRSPLPKLIGGIARNCSEPKTVLPDDGLRRLIEADRIELETWLTRPAGVPCHVEEDGTSVCIDFPGGLIRGPAKLGEVFEYVASAVTMRACDLPSVAGSSYDKLDVARKMVQHGLLQISNES
ncbi:MAG: JmjC domain-containing protein [Pseudonocardiaceae bacterium]